MMDKEICEKIKMARTAKKLTQKQLGELCGYEGRSAESTVQHWEYGTHSIPLSKLRKLSEALGLTLDDLIP